MMVMVMMGRFIFRAGYQHRIAIGGLIVPGFRAHGHLSRIETQQLGDVDQSVITCKPCVTYDGLEYKL